VTWGLDVARAAEEAGGPITVACGAPALHPPAAIAATTQSVLMVVVIPNPRGWMHAADNGGSTKIRPLAPPAHNRWRKTLRTRTNAMEFKGAGRGLDMTVAQGTPGEGALGRCNTGAWIAVR
jgi:hypothetical protein